MGLSTAPNSVRKDWRNSVHEARTGEEAATSPSYHTAASCWRWVRVIVTRRGSSGPEKWVELTSKTATRADMKPLASERARPEKESWWGGGTHGARKGGGDDAEAGAEGKGGACRTIAAGSLAIAGDAGGGATGGGPGGDDVRCH